MNKYNRILIVSVIFLLFCTRVIASTAIGPTCKIKGKITNVSVREAYYQEDNGLPCNYKGRNIPETYFILINISNVSSVEEWGLQKCPEWYAINSIITITFKDNSSKKNQIIEGDIEEYGDECFSGTHFINYTIIKTEENEDIAGYDMEINQGFTFRIWLWIKSLFR